MLCKHLPAVSISVSCCQYDCLMSNWLSPAFRVNLQARDGRPRGVDSSLYAGRPSRLPITSFRGRCG